MKSVISIAAVAVIATVVAAPAFAQGERFKTACAKPGDERVIEIISPGDVGQVCDVRYTYKSSNTVKVPYHANSSSGFCATKAQEVVARLATAGFACANIADDLVVASAPAVKTPVVETTPAAEAAAPQTQTLAQAQAQAQTEPAPAPIAAPSPEAAPEIASAPVAAPAATAVIEPAATAAIEPVATAATKIAQPEAIAPAQAPVPAPGAAPAEIAVAPGADADSLGDKLKSVLDQPAQEQHAAVRGPENLTDKAEPNVVGSGRQASVVGRLLGAEPASIEAPEIELAAAPPATDVPPATGVTPVTQASAAVEAPAPRQEIKVASVTNPAAVQSARDPKDVVRATLRAQSAAWNEGNLDAFMETYWKNDALKFVSGTSVTNGWSTTQKRYRSRYANAAAMGQLRFDKMKVEMVSDDVAIVVGKFNLAHDEKTDTGVFTLVMKRMDGAWRIVHDHTVGDAKG